MTDTHNRILLKGCIAIPFGEDTFVICDSFGLTYEAASKMACKEVKLGGDIYFSPMRTNIKMKDYPNINRDGGEIYDEHTITRIRDEYHKT